MNQYSNQRDSYITVYSGDLSRVKTFAIFAVQRGQLIRESFKHDNFQRIRQRHYHWGCHCRVALLAKVLRAKVRLSAIREGFHPRKVPAIRYLDTSQNV